MTSEFHSNTAAVILNLHFTTIPDVERNASTIQHVEGREDKWDSLIN